ncbi:MAG: DNA modification methylase, partial [Candidatus Marinimicrobia bacterium]|nr:DNA modification methylase [Candidatus Neomarinimicrobiota bacterium]
MTIVTLIPAVLIEVAERQRKKFNEQALVNLKHDINKFGLMNPCTVYRTGGTEEEGVYKLIAGERRYLSILELHAEGKEFECGEIPITNGYIPCNVFNNMEHSRAFEMELNENILREDLTWQERTEAIAELHKLRLAQNPEQTITDTAKEIVVSSGKPNKKDISNERLQVSQAAIIAEYLDVPEVRKASTAKNAYKVVSEMLEKEFMGARVEVDTTDQEHTLIYGDMQTLSDTLETGKFVLMITDPPYGMGVKDFGEAAKISHNYEEKNVEELHSNLATIASRVCQESAHAYVFCDIDLFHFIRKVFQEAGWRVRRTPLIWTKGNRGHRADGGVLGYRRVSELILVATRGSHNYSALSNDVLSFESALEKHHAAQKP